MDLHLQVEGSLEGLVLPLQDGAKEGVTGRLAQVRDLYLDLLRVELWGPQ